MYEQNNLAYIITSLKCKINFQPQQYCYFVINKQSAWVEVLLNNIYIVVHILWLRLLHHHGSISCQNDSGISNLSISTLVALISFPPLLTAVQYKIVIVALLHTRVSIIF